MNRLDWMDKGLIALLLGLHALSALLGAGSGKGVEMGLPVWADALWGVLTAAVCVWLAIKVCRVPAHE